MTDSSLDYGQLGEVAYDLILRKWTSTRSLDIALPVKAQGPVDTYIVAASSTSPAQSDLNPISRSESVRKLTQARPELLPAFSVIDAYLSEALLESHLSGKFFGDLLAFGYAQYADRTVASSGQRRSQSYPVTAIPTGVHHDKLCIVEVRYRQRGWQENNQRYLEVMDMTDTATGIWHGDGGCIRQICFEPLSDTPYTLLAVRTPISIHVLRPLFLPDFVGVESLHVLKTPPRAHAECVDVIFNPWTPKQLAAVDSYGQVVVWDFYQGKKHRKATTNVCFEMRPTRSNSETASFQIADDGWRRVLWICNSETLLLSSRTHLECFNLSGEFLGDEDSITEEDGFQSRIIDIRRNPTRDKELFVVTTRSVICLRVILSSARATFEKLISWKHHRDCNDSSLRLSFLEGAQDIRIMLYSRNDSLATAYSLAYPEASTSPVLQGAPTRCGWYGGGLQDIQFVNLPLKRRAGKSSYHWSEDVKHWQAIALASDLSLSASLFHERPTLFPRTINEPATWSAPKDKIIGRPPKVLKRSDDFVVPDAFVVPDDYSDSGIDAPGLSKSENCITSHGNWTAFEAANTVSNELVSEALDEMSGADTVDMTTFLNNFTTNGPSAAEYESMTLQTLIALVAKPLKVGDVDAVFRSASRFVGRFQSVDVAASNQPAIAPLGSPAALGLSQFESSDQSPSMDLLYQHLLSIYNKPLTSAVQVKPRLAKENAARQVVGTIFLASTGVRLSPSITDELGSVDSVPIPQTASSSSATFPTLQSDPLAESAARLRNYTKVTSTPSIPPADRRRPSTDPVAEILAHWRLHTDPSQYSFRDTTAALTGESAIAGSQMSAETRQRVETQRQRASALEEMRRQRQLRRDAKRRKLDPHVAESQPDPVGNLPSQSASQDAGLGQRRRGEQALGGPVGVASQVEPGRHGGRSLLQLRDRERRPRKKGGFN